MTSLCGLKNIWSIHAILDRHPSQKLNITKTLFLDVQEWTSVIQQILLCGCTLPSACTRGCGSGFKDAVGAEDIKTQLAPEPWRHSAVLFPSPESTPAPLYTVPGSLEILGG